MRKFKSRVYALCVVLLLITILPVNAYADDLTSPYTNLSASYSGSNVTSASAAAGTASMTVTGGTYLSKNGTLTLTNSGSETAILSFAYTATGSYSEFKVNGSSANATGTYRGEIAAGSSATIYLKCAKGTSATVILSDIELVVAKNSNVTVMYNSLGSVSVAGTTVASDTVVTVPSSGSSFVATPGSNASFLGWVATGNKLVSTDLSITYSAESDTTLEAVFVNTASDEAYFKVGNYLYNDLGAAITAAGDSGTILLMNNGFVASGSYTIPLGVTLLLPFDSSNMLRGIPNEVTAYQAGVGVVTTATPPDDGIITFVNRESTTKTVYRTLTMASGAHITVNGSLEVSGQSDCFPYGSYVKGKLSVIQMEAGSSITVNGNLFAWGEIKGSGTVTINSDANVYENFVNTDYMGDAGVMNDINTAGAFPLVEFVLDGVQVPMTLKQGGSVKGFYCLYGNLIGYNTFIIDFISANGMMRNEAGNIEFYYQNSRQKINILDQATLSLNTFKVSLSAAGVTANVDSSTTSGLPVGKDWDIVIKSGGTMIVRESAIMFAGSTLLVEENAELNVIENKHVICLDAETDPSSVETDGNVDLRGTLTVNGSAYTAGSAALRSDGTTGLAIISGATTDKEVVLRSGKSTTTVTVNPIKLQNSDASKVETANGGANTYTYTDGYWRCTTHTNTETTTATCTEAGIKTYTCTVCGYVETEEQEALGHIEGDAATCITDQICTREGCGAVLTEKLGHDFTEQDESVCTLANAGNCQTYKTYYIDCSRCDQDSTEIWTSTTYGDHVLSSSYTSSDDQHYHVCTVDGCSYTDTKVNCSGGTATCTAKAVCSTCGAEYGNMLAHDYETTYRCDETNHWFKCKNCDTSISGEEAHSFDEGVVTDPSCEEAGYTTYTCTVCNYAKQVTGDAATGHTAVTDAAVAATCTTTGLTEGKHCSACNAVITAQEVVPALGHTAVTDAAVAATCTTTGLTEGKHCSVCNAVITAQEVVPALGHTAVTDAAVAATCTSTGLTEGSHCSVCNEVLVAQQVTEKTAHSYEAAVTAPTCTEAGYTTYTCACGDNYKENEVAAIGHTAVADAAVAATCTTTGLTEGSHCGTCGETIVAQEIVAALGHTEVIDAAVSATCKDTGLTEGKHCSVCNEVIVAQTVTAKLETHTWENGKCTVCEISSEGVCTHTPDEGVVTKPTCTEGGYTTYTCSTCGLVYQGDATAASGHTPGAAATCTDPQICMVCNVQLAAAIGHNYVAVVTDPTCSAQGYTTHTCANCNDSYMDSYTEKVAHTSGEPNEENRLEATCTTDGSYDTVIYCTECSAEISRTTSTIPATGHTMPDIWTQTTAPTCTAAGEEGRECANCDYAETQAIAATGHSETAVVTAPTCTAEGYTTYTCSVCKNVRTDNAVAATGHTNGDAVTENEVAATCTTDGSYDTVVYCTVCKAEVSRETTVVSANGHTDGAAVKENEKPATCGTDGSYDSVVYCTVCSAELSRVQTVTPATGAHNYVTETERVEPTCNTDGYVTNACYCGAAETTLLAQLGHKEVNHDAKSPTCIAVGWEAYVTCERCDYSTYVEIPATNEHLDSDEDQDHICDTEGCDKVLSDCSDAENDGNHKCDICGAVDISEHTEAEAVIENNMAATCGSSGSYESVVYCSECKQELSREKITTNATGNHTGGAATCNALAVCGVCGQSYGLYGDHTWLDATYTAAKTCSVCGEEDGKPLAEVTNTESSEEITNEQINEALTEIAGGITVQPEDSGITSDANQVKLDSVKTEMENTYPEGADYEYKPSIEIVMTAATVGKSGENVVANKITYDVTPKMVARDGEGNVVDSTAITEFPEEITFHLPVDANTPENARAHVTHTHGDTVEDKGWFQITVDGTNKYVVVKSAKFSEFTLEIAEDCTEHTYGDDGICTVCGAEKAVDLFDLYGSNMTLGNNLAVNFFILKSNLVGTDYYVEITKAYHNDQETVTKRIEFSDFIAQGDLWRVTFDGVAAKEMTDNIVVNVYKTDGTLVSNEYTISIRDYAMKALNSDKVASTMKTVAVDMLNYGAAAQQYFDYNTEDLANNLLTAAQQALGTQSVSYSSKYAKGEKYYGTVLSLESNIVLNMYHYPITTDMRAVIKYTDYDGIAHEVSVDGDEFSARGDLLGIVVDELVVADGYQIVTCEIYDENDNLISTTTDSIESYVARAMSSTLADPVFENLLKFVYSAREYFLND